MLRGTTGKRSNRDQRKIIQVRDGSTKCFRMGSDLLPKVNGYHRRLTAEPLENFARWAIPEDKGEGILSFRDARRTTSLHLCSLQVKIHINVLPLFDMSAAAKRSSEDSMATSERTRFPPRGTKCRGRLGCHRPATRYGVIGKLVRGAGRVRFSHERRPFCQIHAIENEFGLMAYSCPSNRCLRRRFAASGGWLNFAEKPEDGYIYVPIEGTLDDVGDETNPPIPPTSPVNSVIKCPWCHARMRSVR